jgi:anti-sigma regulatory factor (Ser/Thr protein kinase)
MAGLPAEVVDDGRLVASELASNAVDHSRSALPGGKYTGRIEVGADTVVIEVTDQGSDTRPEVVALVDADADHGRGRGLLICSKVGHLVAEATPDGGSRVSVRLPIPAAGPAERVGQEVAELRASGCSREVYEQICGEHPEDAQAIAYRLSGIGGAR